MSVKLLQQLYASFTKTLRAERVNLPLQTFTRVESLRKVGWPSLRRFTQTLILRKSPFSCRVNAFDFKYLKKAKHI